MRFALYGLPCAGKTTLMCSLQEVFVVHGSDTLRSISGGNFSSLSEKEKESARIAYTEYLTTLPAEIILSDGHFSFGNEIVFTEADAKVYDVFFYLYCDPNILKDRYSFSAKNESYADLSIQRISSWQQFEIESLREECHRRNKDFYVLPASSISGEMLEQFIHRIYDGFSCFTQAEYIVKEIKSLFPTPCHLHIVDGDKTIIKQDSFRVCSTHKTSCFDGDFYTGYQSLCFSDETSNLLFDYDKVATLQLNPLVYDRVQNVPYVILSAGITRLWKAVGEHLGLSPVFADPTISADTKYFVVKILQNAGYTISAYGDSKNDLYMLRAADHGFLYVGDRISRSITAASTSGLQLLYDKSHTLLESEHPEELEEDIAICKSGSGINGSKLAAAHLRLGQKLGMRIKKQFPTDNMAVIVLDRGGRFFGDGMYSTLGGVFYPFNPGKEQIPLIKEDIIVIVDSVINTGNSTLRLIAKLEEQRPDAQIILATNVIQQQALSKFNDYRLFAIRASSNSFVGKNQAVQTGKTGPDTADRLYNLISKGV